MVKISDEDNENAELLRRTRIQWTLNSLQKRTLKNKDSRTESKFDQVLAVSNLNLLSFKPVIVYLIDSFTLGCN